MARVLCLALMLMIPGAFGLRLPHAFSPALRFGGMPLGASCMPRKSTRRLALPAMGATSSSAGPQGKHGVSEGRSTKRIISSSLAAAVLFHVAQPVSAGAIAAPEGQGVAVSKVFEQVGSRSLHSLSTALAPASSPFSFASRISMCLPGASQGVQ